jgi:hypothetical protein
VASVRRYVALVAVAAAALWSASLTPVGAAAAVPAATTGARAVMTGETWGTAEKVPGLAALSHGHGANLDAVSCASAGNCSAGGSYTDSGGFLEAFVVSQTNGTWHTAIEVPGTAALNQAGFAEILSVSCASAGNCSAGGYYTDSADNSQAFVVSQAHGTWGTAIEVPGTAALNQGGGAAEILSVSCASAGNCSAGGTYGNAQAFVVSQANGTWRKAIEVPGTAALNQGGVAEITSVSCASAGNCAAGGQYADNAGDFQHRQAFVVSQANGTWGAAIEVPGTAALNQGGGAEITSVSCASAGNCSAGGYYTDSSRNRHAFVVSQVHGTWHTAIEVPGTAALNGSAAMTSVSCASAGNCSAGGYYGKGQAFVVSQANGTWHKAIEVPGTAALNQGGGAEITSVSCASAGNCAAGGSYSDSSRRQQAFVVSQTGGTWHTAIEVPGTAALNQGGGAEITSVSCASAGNCTAGGAYHDSSGNRQAFVVSET